MTQEEYNELMEWSSNELGGLSQRETKTYDYEIALQVAIVMQKDVETFKTLPPKEQEEKYWEYKNEMDALSDKELEERIEKYYYRRKINDRY